jgi:cell division protease FtsH
VNQFYKNLSLWLVISLMMILLFNMFNKPKPTADKISYSDFISQVEAGKITAVTIQGNDVYGKYEGKDAKEFRTYKPNSDADLTQMLLDKKVTIQAKPDEEKFSWFSIFISWFPLILLVGVWIFFMRQMQVGGGKAMSFGKSRAKLLTENQVKITFEDVAGIEEAKEGWQDTQGGAADGPSGHRQDPAGPRHRRGGGCTVFLHLRLGLCRDVRGRRRQPGP